MDLARVKSGWMTWSALVTSRQLPSVRTMGGAVITVVITRMYPSPATHRTTTVSFLYEYPYLPEVLTRRSPEDEIVNMNFLYDDIVHILQNTIDWRINSTTCRRSYVLKRRFTKFSEITQCNGHYAVQGHSRSPILVPVRSSYTTFH